MKKNIDYYPHKTEAHRHPKFRMLRSIYGNKSEGWAAEGRFWALNNLIASSEDCRLNLTKKRNKGVFADELGLSLEEFDKFISVLIGEDVELLIELEPGIFTTDTVFETYTGVSQERERARDKKQKSVKNTGSPENIKSSKELPESSASLDNIRNKIRLDKMKLNEIRVRGEKTEQQETLPLTSLPELNPTFLTKPKEEYIPDNFKNYELVKNKIATLLFDYCIIPKKEEITRFFNIVIKTDHVKASTAFDYLFEICREFKGLSEDKRNYAYLSSTLEKRLDTALHQALKKVEAQKPLNGNGLQDIQEAANKLSIH